MLGAGAEDAEDARKQTAGEVDDCEMRLLAGLLVPAGW